MAPVKCQDCLFNKTRWKVKTLGGNKIDKENPKASQPDGC